MTAEYFVWTVRSLGCTLHPMIQTAGTVKYGLESSRIWQMVGQTREDGVSEDMALFGSQFSIF